MKKKSIAGQLWGASLRSKLIVIAIVALIALGIGVAAVAINYQADEHANSGKENKKPKYNLNEMDVIVHLPDETGGITNKNLVKASEITNIPVEDLKNLKHLSICHNEKQCMEMEGNMTEMEDNPYRNPKPKGKAFGVKIVNKTKD